MRRICIYILFILWSSAIWSQDCFSPITACSGVTETLDSTSFSGGFGGPCFTALESIFFEFTTNNNAENPSGFLPYEVEIDVFIESCIDAGTNLTVNAGVFTPTNGTDPCLGLAEYTPCVLDSNSFVFNSGVLAPNTTYILVLGIDPTTVGFGCELEVTLTGAPLEINACCDDNILPGESSDLFVFGVTPISGNENYVWSPPAGLDDFQSATPIASPTSTTTYTVSGLVGDCVTTDEITIKLKPIDELITPQEVTSPNGDGINDFWLIVGIEEFENPQVYIFDRWGQQVFRSSGYDNPWDGTNEGKRLATGAFYYVIEVTTPNFSESLTGHVSLLN